MSEPFPPLILTLKLDPKTFQFFDHWRQQYFPPERNFLPAHVTLFHALPGERESEIQQVLRELCASTSVMVLTFPALRLLGQGVAAEVNCAELLQLRQHLTHLWQDELSRQDRQGYRPHITVQNKVSPDAARQVYEQLSREWNPFRGYGEGLLLWYYRGGPWEWVNEFSFNINSQTTG